METSDYWEQLYTKEGKSAILPIDTCRLASTKRTEYAVYTNGEIVIPAIPKRYNRIGNRLSSHSEWKHTVFSYDGGSNTDAMSLAYWNKGGSTCKVEKLYGVPVVLTDEKYAKTIGKDLYKAVGGSVHGRK